MSEDTVLSFSGMLRGALGESIAADASTFVEMFAVDGIMEFPFAPTGGTTRLDGRAAVAEYLQSVASELAFDRMSNPTVHRTSDPRVVVLEFMAFGRGLKTGEPYEQTYISVIEVRDGHIVRYRDYWNPLVLLRATGGMVDIAPTAGLPDHD
jgi:uncharacterized protein